MLTQQLKTSHVKIEGMTCSSCEIMLERKLKAVDGVISVNVNHTTGIATITADATNLPSLENIASVIQDAGYRLAEHGVDRQVLKVRIDGMTCNNCERLLREKLKLVAGVKHASVHYEKGTANIFYRETKPVWDDLAAAVESAGYKLRHLDEFPLYEEPRRKKWLEIGASLLIIFALYKILQAFKIISFASSLASASTLGGIFVIGLVAGTSSCLAVTGGLLLSMAAKHNELNESKTRWEKFKPLLSFNIGRLASYFFFGGLVGILGKSITLSPRMTGYMNIIVAVIMIYLALSILKIIKKGSLGIRLPKRFSHRIANLSESKHPAAPFSLGAFTFFLPCGFTQSLQIAALASGSFITGGLTMFVFALGTLPALLGISTISATAKGSTSRLFLRFSGALVLVLAIFNLNSGLLLTGYDASNFFTNIFSNPSSASSLKEDPNVTIASDGTQVINMRITAYGYEPNSFTIQGGVPTIVKAQADSDIGGCTKVLTAPAFGLTKYLQLGAENKLGPFTPAKNFLLTCSMGMVKANVRVVGGSANEGAKTVSANASIPSNAQVVDLTWTSNGYNPNVLEVNQGAPTVVKISSTTQTGGCMSTIVFPQFNESAFVPAPGNEPVFLTLATDKAESGDYPITCGMGSKMGILRVNPA